MRRALLLVTSLTALAAAAPAVVHAATIGGVRIVVNGQPGPRLTHELLADRVDVQRTNMTTRYANGSPPSSDPHGGVSAARLVALAGIDTAHVLELSVRQPLGNGATVLTRADVVSGFPEGPALFDPDYNSTEVHFFRPQRDASDVNAPDAVDPPLGTDLLVSLRTDGGVLSVSASADPAQADAGAPVDFNVQVAGAPSDVTYAWDFGDGTDATTTAGTIAHAYATDGSYDATVAAVTKSGDSGAAIVHVQVGTLSGAAGGTTGGGGTSPHTGGGSGGRNATSTGRVHGGARQPTGHGVTRGSDDARVHNQSTTARPAATTPAATPTATSRTAVPSRAAPPHDPLRHGPQAHRHGRGTPAAGTTPHVSGVLLASSGDAASVLSSLERADRGTGRDNVARASATGAGSLRGWLLGGLALAALLGLGVGREAGVRLRLRRPAGAA